MLKKLFIIYIVLVLTSCNVFAQTLIPFSSGGKYGYLNSQLKIVIAPQFFKTGHFTEEGYAIVAFGQGMTMTWIIDTTGKMIKGLERGLIYHIYGDIYSFENSEPQDMEIIRLNNNKIIAKKTHWPGITTKEGYMLAEFYDEVKRYSFIDFEGNRVLQQLTLKWPSYSFFDERANVRNESGRVIIDMEGNILGEFSSLAHRYSEGLIAAKSIDGITGYVNKSGNFEFTIPFITSVIPEATFFSGGYAAIKKSETPSVWRIINTRGQEVSGNINVYTMNAFSDGLSRVMVRETTNGPIKYGYVNTRGEYLVKPILESADDFQNGYARIVYNGQEGLLKTNGKVIWSADIMKGNIVEKELY